MLKQIGKQPPLKLKSVFVSFLFLILCAISWLYTVSQPSAYSSLLWGQAVDVFKNYHQAY